MEDLQIVINTLNLVLKHLENCHVSFAESDHANEAYGKIIASINVLENIKAATAKNNQEDNEK